MGKISRQRRNRLRMTIFNIAKSNEEKESQQNKIANLQKELSFQKIKHEDTLGFYKKGLSLQEGYFYLKYEKETLNFKHQLIENEASFHNSLLQMEDQKEILKQIIFHLEKEIECLKIKPVPPSTKT